MLSFFLAGHGVCFFRCQMSLVICLPPAYGHARVCEVVSNQLCDHKVISNSEGLKLLFTGFIAAAQALGRLWIDLLKVACGFSTPG